MKTPVSRAGSVGYLEESNESEKSECRKIRRVYVRKLA